MRAGKKLAMLVLGFICSEAINIAYAANNISDVTMNISMNIADVTCQVNSGQGVSQQIIMPIVSLSELQGDNAKSMEAPLKVDCSGSPSQPNYITISVGPSGGSSVIDGGINGMLKTNKTGVGLYLYWKVNSNPVILAPATTTTFYPDISTGGVWDLTMVAKPVAVAGELAVGGDYIGAVIVNLRYS